MSLPGSSDLPIYTCTKIRKTTSTKVTQSQIDIAAVCDELKELLLDKNRKYGDSALNPVRIFSQASTVEQLKVRMDDKLSRLRNAQTDDDEDPITDLIGYLVLYKVAMMQQRRVDEFVIS